MTFHLHLPSGRIPTLTRAYLLLHLAKMRRGGGESLSRYDTQSAISRLFPFLPPHLCCLYTPLLPAAAADFFGKKLHYLRGDGDRGKEKQTGDEITLSYNNQRRGNAQGRAFQKKPFSQGKYVRSLESIPFSDSLLTPRHTD